MWRDVKPSILFVCYLQNKLKRIGKDAELRGLSIVFRIAINPAFKGAVVSKMDKQKVNKMVCGPVLQQCR